MLLTVVDQRLDVFWEAATFETTPGFQIVIAAGKIRWPLGRIGGRR